MEVRKILNKKGEVLKTQEGVELEELRFEAGDEFIPLFNSVFEKKNDAIVDGKQKVITNYSIKCRVRDVDGNVFKHRGSDEVFVTITKTQANSLKKITTEQGIELNQHLFHAYKYVSDEYGEQVGVGLKASFKPAKSFEDFENNDSDEVAN